MTPSRACTGFQVSNWELCTPHPQERRTMEWYPRVSCLFGCNSPNSQSRPSFLTRECDSNERVIAVSGGWNSLVPCLLTMAIVSYFGPEPIRHALVSIFRNSLRKCRSNWNAFWIWAPRVYTDHRFNRELLGRMFSSVHLHPTSSGARWIFGDGRAVGSDGLTVVWIACTSKEVIANLIRLFVVDRRRNLKWLQPLTTAVVKEGSEPLGGSAGMFPREIWKSGPSKTAIPFIFRT